VLYSKKNAWLAAAFVHIFFNTDIKLQNPALFLPPPTAFDLHYFNPT